jgi:hypothetical protein
MIMAVNATPTFTPTGGQVANASTFEIACVTAGVTIYYSFGSAPANIGWTVYTGAVTLPATGSTVNVSAYAVKAGETDSAVATTTFYTVGYSAAVSAAAPAVLDTNATQGLGAVCEGIGKTGADGSSIGASRIGGSPGTDLKIETNA